MSINWPEIIVRRMLPDFDKAQPLIQQSAITMAEMAMAAMPGFDEIFNTALELAAQKVDDHCEAWGLGYRSMTDQLSKAIRDSKTKGDLPPANTSSDLEDALTEYAKEPREGWTFPDERVLDAVGQLRAQRLMLHGMELHVAQLRVRHDAMLILLRQFAAIAATGPVKDGGELVLHSKKNMTTIDAALFEKAAEFSGSTDVTN